MRILLSGFIALVALAWGWDAGSATEAASAWTVRRDALYLTGLESIALMSLAMVLATRPAWLEGVFGGMDRIYRTHKWAGILAVGFAAAHWLVEMSDDLLEAFVGRDGRPSKEHVGGVLDAMRDLAEDLGEWAIYALLAMLALTLWKRFPFKPWRLLHRAMPVLYLLLAFHAAFLAPLDYWSRPAGLLLALCLGAGSASAAIALAGRIGRRRRFRGIVESVAEPGPGLTEVVCHVPGWNGHRPGQFAFASFDRLEGAHPFTIAGADRGDGRLVFQIKALGDYTRGLAGRLRAGQAVEIEGPYGRFALDRRARRAEQIWIAGGVGVTPFLAWLEALQAADEVPAADFYYCTRQRDTDPFVPRLQTLCATLPTIRLRILSSDRDAPLNAQTLAQGRVGRPEIWFCGPRGLADALRGGLATAGIGGARFHQEAFEMR